MADIFKKTTKRPFTMHWSNLSKYERCGQSFLWSRGWEDIDLGGGPGKKKPVETPKSREYACMGIAIQSILEDLYNKSLWKHPQGLAQRLEQEVLLEFERLVDSEYIDWEASFITKTEAREMCAKAVVGFLDTMKHNRLLGPYARSEVGIYSQIDDFPIGGKVDFMIRRDDGIMILDGKNSRDTKSATRQSKNDPDQLRWYALCFLLKYGRLPDRLGYVWYQHPFDAETGEQGMEWVPFEKRDLQGIAQRARDARRGMHLRVFNATPSTKACKFCDYENQCEARQEMKRKNKEKREKRRIEKLKAQGIPVFGDFELEM